MIYKLYVSTEAITLNTLYYYSIYNINNTFIYIVLDYLYDISINIYDIVYII